MISLILAWAGLAITLIALAAAFTRRLPPRQYAALYAVGAALSTTACIVTGDHLGAGIDAVAFAYWLHRWWTGGGGDDTRRRLRGLRRAFRPTRRTAPSTA